MVDHEDNKHDPYAYYVTEYPDGHITMDTPTMQLAVLLDIRDLLYKVVDHKKDTDKQIKDSTNRIKSIEDRFNKFSDELKERVVLFDDEDKK